MMYQEPYVEVIKTLSPIQFKMCFTSQERIAIKALKDTDELIEDAYEIIDDPRLKDVDLTSHSVIGLVQYLASLNVIEPHRGGEIL